MKLFLLEDDIDIVNGLTYALNNANYEVDYASNINDAILKLDNNYDLYILDITLPDGNGYDFFKEYISDQKVIFLTAIAEEDTIVNAIIDGAEDYITKPFSNRELIARINKVLKNNSVIKIKDILIDMNNRQVIKNNEIINLTSLEFNILQLLVSNMGKIVTRDNIINNIYKWTGNDVYDNTVTVYLKRLREKLNSDVIQTVKGIGYRIKDEK